MSNMVAEYTTPEGNGFHGLPTELLLDLLTRLDLEALQALIKVNRAFRAVFLTYHQTVLVNVLKNTKTTAAVAELFAHLSPHSPDPVKELPGHVQSLRHMLKVEQLCKATRQLALKLEVIDWEQLIAKLSYSGDFLHVDWLIDRLGLEFDERLRAFLLNKDLISYAASCMAKRRIFAGPPSNPSDQKMHALFYHAAIRFYHPTTEVSEIVSKLPYKEPVSPDHWKWMKKHCDRLLLEYIYQQVYRDSSGTPGYWWWGEKRRTMFHVFLRHAGAQWLLDVRDYDGTDEDLDYYDEGAQHDGIWEKVQRAWEKYGPLYEKGELEW